MSNPEAPDRWYVSALADGQSLELNRGDCVIGLVVEEGLDAYAECLNRLIEHTPAHMLIAVIDTRPNESAVISKLVAAGAGGALRRPIAIVQGGLRSGRIAMINALFKAAAPGDVALLSTRCLVAADWLSGLRAAADSDTVIAAAAPLSNGTVVVSAPCGDEVLARLPQRWTVDEAARAVRSRSPRLLPRVPLLLGPCVYVKRSALELVGDFDAALSDPAAAATDFSLRCLKRGLSTVIADDTYVYRIDDPRATSAGSAGEGRRRDQRVLRARHRMYPAISAALSAEAETPLNRSVAAGRRAVEGLTVAIDATCLGHAVTGTQVLTMELIEALAEVGGAALRVTIPHYIGRATRERLGSANGVELFQAHESGSVPAADVVHRPFQLTELRELRMLRRLGKRMVITQQDMIAYRNPSYFPTARTWRQFQAVTRQGLAAADLVVFCSQHGLNDAHAEGLVDRQRSRVVHNGCDHRLPAGAGRRPVALAAVQDAGFLLCVGTDFHHKNRVFALQVAAALIRDFGWRGHLVLAGPRVADGSSAEEEARYLLENPDVAQAIVRVGYTSAEDMAWLYAHADAVLYPTTYEGFGLVPFEAAFAGTACLFAPQASLAEVLPRGLATVVPWDAVATARNVLGILDDSAARSALIADLREAGTRFTWREMARQMLECYWEAAAAPARSPLATPSQAVNAALTDRLALESARHPRLAGTVLGGVRRARQLGRSTADRAASMRWGDH